MGIFIVYAVIIVIGALLHTRFNRQPRTRRRLIEIWLLWILVIGIGLTGVVAFIGHAFFADSIAEKIGWPTGSPFQFEVAVADLAIGVLGFMCIWFRGNFWLATIVAASVFLLGDAYGHIHEIVVNNNHEPGNAGAPLYFDFALPLLAIALYAAYKRAGGWQEAQQT